MLTVKNDIYKEPFNIKMKIAKLNFEIAKQKNINIYYDIETYLYNTKQLNINPTKTKCDVFTVCISYIDSNKEVNVILYDSFVSFFKSLDVNLKNIRVNLIGKNINKYDNHFLLASLKNDLNYKEYNKSIFEKKRNQKIDVYDNYKYMTMKELSNDKYVVTSRIKTKTNVTLDFCYKNIKFTTIDTYPKTNTSLKTSGDMLLRNELIDEKYLKTEMNYTKYNLVEDMTKKENELYKKNIFINLTEDEIKYIYNDVIILAYEVYYYNKLFYGYDFKKMTFTSNVIEKYNELDENAKIYCNLEFDKNKLNNSDYIFKEENFSYYLRKYFKGGLNYYNDNYIETMINNVFVYDINSAYPNSMYGKVPFYIEEYKTDKYNINVKEYLKFNNKEKYFELLEISIFDFNKLMSFIESIQMRKIFTKYFNKGLEHVYINNIVLDIFMNFINKEIININILSSIKYSYISSPLNNGIEEFYKQKTQAKGHNINYVSPRHITKINDEKIGTSLSYAENYVIKVNLNGIYGYPALRPFFNITLYDTEKDELNNIVKGFRNNERNIILSIYTTAYNLDVLLSPLYKYKQKDLDEDLLYIDTDSIHVKDRLNNYIQQNKKDLLNDYELGKYSKDEENIKYYYIQNNKKYCYIDRNNTLVVKSGGVNKDYFFTFWEKIKQEKTSIEDKFKKFTKYFFSSGVVLDAVKSIYNEDRVIVLYNSKMKLEPACILNEYIDEKENIVIQDIKDEIVKEYENSINAEISDETLYYELSNGMTFSETEIFSNKNDYENEVNFSIDEYIEKQKLIFSDIFKKV